MAHLFVRDGSAGFRISEATLHHDCERQLAKDFLGRTVVRLVLDHLDQMCLGWTHWRIVPRSRRGLATPQAVRRTLELSCEAPIVPGFVSFDSLFCGAVLLLDTKALDRRALRETTRLLVDLPAKGDPEAEVAEFYIV